MSLSFPHLAFEALEQYSGASLRAELSTAGALLIERVPLEDDHRQLVMLAENLGACIQEPWLPPGEKVTLVQLDPVSAVPAYADTPFAFGLHTDCSEQPDPPELVILQCVRAAAEGGESHFLPLPRLLAHLPLADQHLLTHPVFHFRQQFFPILQKTQTGYTIRYNRLYQEIFKSRGGLMAPEYEELLDRLEVLMTEQQETFRLKPGDCWLLLNKYSLHGRSAFSSESDRLLKRIRLRMQV